jgi:KDO II ethanolaminephosphotransferase
MLYHAAYLLFGAPVVSCLATLLVLSSVAASYYMVLFHVDIGYGILAAVMTTDVDLSKESVGWHFGVWMVLVSLLPLLLIWLAPMHEAAFKRGNQLALVKKRRDYVGRWPVLLATASVDGQVQDQHDRENNQMMASYGGVVAGSYSPSNWLSALGLLTYSSYSQAETAGICLIRRRISPTSRQKT